MGRKKTFVKTPKLAMATSADEIAQRDAAYAEKEKSRAGRAYLALNPQCITAHHLRRLRRWPQGLVCERAWRLFLVSLGGGGSGRAAADCDDKPKKKKGAESSDSESESGSDDDMFEKGEPLAFDHPAKSQQLTPAVSLCIARSRGGV